MSKPIAWLEADRPWYQTVFHPNVFTEVRLCSTPVILVFLAIGESRRALALFILAELTDILDGYLSRRWNLASEFGAFFDSLTDKLFHLPLFFWFLVYPKPDLPHRFLIKDVLAHIGWTRLAFAVILLIEVMLVLSRTSWLERWRTSASNKANVFGKAKTWIMAFSIGGYIAGTRETVTMGQALVVVAIVSAALSFTNRIRFVRDGR